MFLVSAVNLVAFLAMGYDKLQAKRSKVRIPEKILLILALLLGACGVYLGMLAFRHKTKKPLFRYGVPFLLMLNLYLIGVLDVLK